MRSEICYVLGVAALAGCIDLDEPEKLSTATQHSNVYSSALMSMKPVMYWRLGDLKTTTLTDSGPSHNHGFYKQVKQGYNGAIVGDPNSSVFFIGESGWYGEVPDHDFHSLTRAWDFFGECTSATLCQDGWGRSGDPSRESDAPDWEMQLGPDSVINNKHFGTEPIGSPFRPAAYIDPGLYRTTFQQGLRVTLRDGDMQVRGTWSQTAFDGPLHPISLVARRVDEQNYVRAELTEQPGRELVLRIIQTVGGVDRVLATRTQIGTYKDEWWYVRFQFEGSMLRARAWRQATGQPIWWLTSKYVGPTAGTIAVRASNENSSARPIFRFTDFWAQTLGLSVSFFVKPENFQPNKNGGKYVNFLGKASRSNWQCCDTDPHTGNAEYEFRFTPAGVESATLKGYVFNLAGGLGAGQNVDRVVPGRWYHIVMVLDSGDALDQAAGVTMYVNGNLDRDGMGNVVRPEDVRTPHAGSMYNGASHCDSDGSSWTLEPPPPGVPGRCRDNKCRRYSDGAEENCWTIYPARGDSPFRFGNVQNDSIIGADPGWFNGALDEVAIFDRKLTDSEVQMLYNSSL